MKRSYWFRAVTVWLSISIMLVGCAPADSGKSPPAPAPKAASGPVKLKLAQPAPSLAFAAIYLANNAGYFKENGVEVEQVLMQGSAPASAAVVNGDVQAFAGDLGKIFLLSDREKDRVILVQLPNNSVTLDLVFSNAFMAKRGLTPQQSLDDRLRAMKGSKMGIPDIGGTSHKSLAFLMQKAGLNPDKDFEAVSSGNPPATVAALKNGTIDGFMLTAPTSLQVEADNVGKIVAKFSDVPEFKDTPSLGIAVRADFAQQNPSAVKGMVQAMAKAHTLLAGNPSEAAKLLQPSFPGIKPELLEASIKELVPAFGNRGRISADALKKTVSLLRAQGFLDRDVALKEGVDWTNEYNQ